MVALTLHTGTPTLHWEDNTSCFSVFEAKRFTPRVKQIDIPICFLQENFDNGIFLPKYQKPSVMPVDICTKLWSSPIISWGTKWMTGFRFYPTSETEHYQFKGLYEFIVK